MKRICCLALALGLPLGTLSAQETRALAAGVRVRVLGPKPVCNYPEEAPCYRKVVGSLQSIDSASIVIRREDGETVSVSRAPGTRLDVSNGRGACGAPCIGLGFLGGAGLGALVGWISVQAQGGTGPGSYCSDSPCGLVVLFTVPAGAVLGTIVGALLKKEHWKAVEPPARIGVGPVGPGRFAAGLSLRF